MSANVLESSQSGSTNRTRNGDHDPEGHNDPGGDPVHGFASYHGNDGLFAAPGRDLGRNDLEEKGDSQRDENQVVRVAEDGDEVRAEVNRAERVPNDAGR